MANQSLPVFSFRSKIVDSIEKNAVTIIKAETGAGKSTQVIQYLLEEGYKIVVTQPRRLAARTVAMRVAEEMGCEIGGLVGYRTANEKKDSKDTRCLFCTDGLALVRELIGGGNPADVLVLDEVHEWNMNIEVLVGWAKRALQDGAQFKLVLMSATIEADRLAEHFNNAPVIDIPGRLFPVEDRNPSSSIEADVAALVREGRNVLVFQPGKAEIEATIAHLRMLDLEAEILPLHGQLDMEEQAKCFKHFRRPKVVVSTNVAQTSVTIDDIDAVVDSGAEKRIEVVNGVEGLYTRPISLADSKQRKGRAGRCKPGVYIDHCTAFDRPEFAVPEIGRVSLNLTLLRLKIAGFDMEELDLFHAPSKDAIQGAKKALTALGCLDAKGAVTPIGKKIASLPLSPNIGRMVIEAIRLGVLDDAITVAAILEEGGITNRKVDGWKEFCRGEKESDVLAQLSVFQAVVNLRLNAKEMREKGIFTKSFFRVKEIRENIRTHLKLDRREMSSSGNREDILKAVCSGMVDHLYRNEYGSLRNGDNCSRQLDQFSVINSAEWLVGVPFDLQIQTRRGRVVLNLVVMASKVTPAMMLEVAPQLVVEEKGLNPQYSAEHDSVVSTTRVMFNGRLLEEKIEIDRAHPEAAPVFAAWLASTSRIGRDDVEKVISENRAQQERARSLNVRAGETVFAVFDSRSLREFYLNNLSGARRLAEIRNVSALKLPELDAAKEAEILATNPDSIELLGARVVSYQNGYEPSVTFTEEEFKANLWTKLQGEGYTLPSGRRVMVAVKTSYYNSVSKTDFAELKKQLREIVVSNLWQNWKDRPEIAVPVAGQGGVFFVVEATYGTDPLDGSALKAFGNIAVNRNRNFNSDPLFTVEWHQDLETAEASLACASEKLSELLKEKQALETEERRRQAEFEKAQADAEMQRIDAERLRLKEEARKLQEAREKEMEAERQREEELEKQVKISNIDLSKLFGGNVRQLNSKR